MSLSFDYRFELPILFWHKKVLRTTLNFPFSLLEDSSWSLTISHRRVLNSSRFYNLSFSSPLKDCFLSVLDFMICFIYGIFNWILHLLAIQDGSKRSLAVMVDSNLISFFFLTREVPILLLEYHLESIFKNTIDF